MWVYLTQLLNMKMEEILNQKINGIVKTYVNELQTSLMKKTSKIFM